MEAVLFYVFSVLTLGSAILAITRRSVIISAVWLIASLLGVGGLFLLQGAEFLFVAQLIVYIGGVVLLFLIALMLINLNVLARSQRFRRGWPVILLVVLLLAGEFLAVLGRSSWHGEPGASFPASAAVGVEALADTLFSRYLVAFEIASLFLLAAIVGAVLMGYRKSAREDHA